MEYAAVRFVKENRTVMVSKGETLLSAEIAAGLHPDAPCGGRGSCGKCKVLANGEEALACQTIITADIAVDLPERLEMDILTTGVSVETEPDASNQYVLAFDIGTTTVVAYLLDGRTGVLLAQASARNPQAAFGADVISRIQYVLDNQSAELRDIIRRTLAELTVQAAEKANIALKSITLACIVGNTAMHHLFLGIDPKTLTVPPYMPNVFEAMEIPAAEILPIADDSTLRVLPNIAGFVSADTVGCLVATRFDTLDQLTLMIDIGTNGELVLGNKGRRLACSTAAGPAFEGVRIKCGMRGEPGAIDHVTLKNGALSWHVIGNTTPVGLCGSGVIDLVAVLLENGTISESGKLLCGEAYRLEGTDVVLTQRDVREVQLAKAAIRTGIELMAEKLGAAVEEIKTVYLAGAFGNFINPVSACKIGIFPPCLLEKIVPIGNAAGEGAKLCALNEVEFAYSKRLAAETDFLELASLPQFQDRYVDALSFEEDT